MPEATEGPGYSIQTNYGGGHQWSPEGNPDIAEALVGSITSTLRNQYGGRLYGDVTDDSRVTIENVEMSVAQARARGLVDIQDGRLIEGPRDSQGTRQEQPDAEGEPDGFLELDAEYVDDLSNWTEAIKAHTGSGQAVTATISAFLSDPSTLPPLMQSMAEAQGADPSVFHTRAQEIGAAIEADLDRKVTEWGVEDLEDFWASVRQRVPGPDLNRVFVEVVTSGDDVPLKELVDHYMRTSALGDDHDQPVTVTIDGRRVQTTVGAARLRGYL